MNENCWYVQPLVLLWGKSGFKRFIYIGAERGKTFSGLYTLCFVGCSFSFSTFGRVPRLPFSYRRTVKGKCFPFDYLNSKAAVLSCRVVHRLRPDWNDVVVALHSTTWRNFLALICYRILAFSFQNPGLNPNNWQTSARSRTRESLASIRFSLSLLALDGFAFWPIITTTVTSIWIGIDKRTEESAQSSLWNCGRVNRTATWSLLSVGSRRLSTVQGSTG